MSEENMSHKFFSAIITDLNMPVMSGQTLIRKIRKYEEREGLEETAIIVLSENSSEEEKTNYLERLGVSKYLSKPVTLFMIEKVLKEIQDSKRGDVIRGITARTIMQIEEIVERRIQILVVDDDIFSSQILLRKLIENNYLDSFVAYSGAEVI